MRVHASPFDSGILGQRVGRAFVQGLDAALIDELRAEMRAGGLDLVFVRDTNFAFENAGALPWAGLELADVKMTLSRTDLSVVPQISPGLDIVLDPSPADAPRLTPLVREIAGRSRFRRIFGEAVAFRLYDAWLANVLAREAADWCFVARPAGAPGDIGGAGSHAPAGFIAVKRDGPGAELTLVATSEHWRGRGVLTFMISHVLATLRAEGIAVCTVGTQLSNQAALRAYQALGFFVQGVAVDLHLHPAR